MSGGHHHPKLRVGGLWEVGGSVMGWRGDVMGWRGDVMGWRGDVMGWRGWCDHRGRKGG